MKTRACAWVAGAMGLAMGLAASAIEISDELRLQIQQDVEAIEKEGPKMGEVMAALREAGGSYVPEIVAPIDVDRYQTMERRRWMTGVYLMDLTYATTFGQRDPAARTGQALYQLLDLLGFPQPEMERRYREALEQIDQPGGDERLRELAQGTDEDPSWKEMLRSSAGVDLVADGLYGFLIEGLHLTSELCVLSDYDPAFLMYVGYMRESCEAYKRLLYRLGDSAEFATSIDHHKRLNFLTSILIILGEMPEVGRDQLDALRPAIADARREIVQ